MTTKDIERRAPIFGSVVRERTSCTAGPRLVPSSHRYQGTRVFSPQETALTTPQIAAQPAVPAAAVKGGIAGHRPWSPDPA